MPTKYYRCKTTNFMWDEGAILSSNGSGYRAIDELFNHTELGSEYISDHIVENKENADFFERVYAVNLLTKTVYHLKDEAKKLLTKDYKSE